MATLKASRFILVIWAFSLIALSVSAQSNSTNINPLDKQIAEIDILFVYAIEADQSYDGGAENWINRLVTLTNQAMTDSNVYIRINNVGMQAVEYPANVNFNTALADIKAGVNDALIDIDNVRYELGADVVSFVISGDTECGEAFGNFQIEGKAHEMYHVIGIGCLDNIFAHELGHNLGLSHSRPQNPSGGFTYEYATGHGFESGFATIMTYPHFFNADSEAVMQFSNSENSCNGYPCGVGREKAGESADAAFALNQIRFQAQDLYSRNPSLISGTNALTNIVDNQLKSCIEEHLDLRKLEYAGALHELECLNRGISSLVGIDSFPNITHLNLTNNQLDSLAPLSELIFISELYVANTGVKDINALSNLKNLGILNITDNGLSNISALADLQYLYDVDLNNNQIASLAPLATPERRWQFLSATANANLNCWNKTFFTNQFSDSVFFSDDGCNPANDDSDHDADGISNNSELTNGTNPFVSSNADGQLVFAKPVFRINEGAQQVVIELRRTSGSQPISATLSATSDSGLINSDVFFADQDIQVSSGQENIQIVADINDDAQLEQAERVIVRLQQSNSVTRYATIVIDDNEQSLQWKDVDIQVSETDTNAELTLELTRSTEQTASVMFTIKPITAFFGNGNDYLVERGVIEIEPNQSLTTLNIPLNQDSIEEASETFMITLFDPTNANLGEQTVAIVTIADDDTPASPTNPIVPPTTPSSSSGGSTDWAWFVILSLATLCRKSRIDLEFF